MSELINNRAGLRWKLLTGASVLALTVSSANLARAEDTDHPLLWVELGGQMEKVTGQGEVFAPAFLAANSSSVAISEPVTPLQAQQPPKFSFGEEGRISFRPEGSDWIFSAAIRYGRSGNIRHVDHQTKGIHYKYYRSGVGQNLRTAAEFADTHANRKETHALLDFTAGKDVGLGMFGGQSSSTLNFGVRFAQFTSKADFDIRARPDVEEKYFTYGPAKFLLSHFNTYHATGHASRSFRGVGPSLSWNGSAPFVGNPQDGELTFDWGANVAVLFGKQKARVQHHASAHYLPPSHAFGVVPYAVVYNPPASSRNPDRSVTVPNVGGSVGLSWRVQDFKVSMGYRADFFFGAMDAGIDAAERSNATFNGPYASISVGLGD